MSSERLANTLVNNSPTLLDIPVYMTWKKNKFGTLKLYILKPEDAKKILEDPEKKDTIEVLNTQWKEASWEEQNTIIEDSQDINPMNNKREPNWNRYRNLRMMTLLVGWDLKLNGTAVPVTPEYIKRLPAEIALYLFEQYEQSVGPEETEQVK